jgi:hypothetical protein
MKQQKQVIALILLLVLGVGIWFWTTHQNPVPAGASSIAAGYAPMTVDNPAIQTWKIDRVRKTEYKSSGRDPFSAVPPPPPPPKTLQPGDQGYVEQPPPPPPPPELPPNMKFYGYGTVPNGSARRAFLTDGDEVYIVAEGDLFLGRYRITKIGNATIEFEEVSSGRQGKTNLEDAGPTT